MFSNKAVFGILTSRSQADMCVDNLVKAGFPSSDISVLMSNPDATKELATEKNTKAPEGAATGATAGGVIGGAIGLLAGIGALAIPCVGPFIAAGPIMGGLAGLGVGAAAGGLIGTLIGLGIPEYEAKRYEGRLKSGGILVSVHCENADMVPHVKEILEKSGAEDIASADESSVKKAS